MFGKIKPFQEEKPSFPEVFERYKNLVFKTAVLMLGSAEEAEDALQEVFVQVYRSLDRYDPRKGALSTWLHRVTVNYCLGQMRKGQLEQVAVEEDALENIPGQEIDVKGREQREAMIAAIGRLDFKQRAVVILRYYWELPYAEIAQVLEIPLGTVKSRLDHATRRLRLVLTEVNAGASTPKQGSSTHREVRPCPTS